MVAALLNWSFFVTALALRTAAHRHGYRHEHHPHAARAAVETCAPVIVTETVYVTATCPPGQCPPPVLEPSSSSTASASVSARLSSSVYVLPTDASPSKTLPVSTPPLSPPPPPSSNSGYSAPVLPQATLPTNVVTSTSAQKPQPTTDYTLLCDHVKVQAKEAGSPIPPMPYGAGMDASLATYNALPTLAAALCQAPEHFHKMSMTPQHGSIKNSCGYEVYVDSVGCGSGGKHELLPTGQTWSEPLRSCSSGGVVYKVTKADAPSKPVQFEVKLEPEHGNLVWYDISFLDCMKPNTTDLTACPGWEGGVQCVPGRQGCQVFVCGPGQYCDGSTYTVPEFGLIKDGPYRNEDWRKLAGAPVTTCKTFDEGIAFELCAAD